jgi:hypothetical protein
MRRKQGVSATQPNKPGETPDPADARRDELHLLDEAIIATENAAGAADDAFAWELSLQGLRAMREAMAPREALCADAPHLRDHIAILPEPAGRPEGWLVELAREEKVRSNLLDTALEDVELSVRTSNCLRKENINTLGELITRTESELLGIRNLGKRSFDEVMERLAQYNLHLRSGVGAVDSSDV